MPEAMTAAERSVGEVAIQLNAVQIGMSGWAAGSLPGLLRELVTKLETAVDEMAAERAAVRRETAREIAEVIRAGTCDREALALFAEQIAIGEGS